MPPRSPRPQDGQRREPDVRVSDSELAFMLESGLHEWTPELLALDLRDSRAEVDALQVTLAQARKALVFHALKYRADRDYVLCGLCGAAGDTAGAIAHAAYCLLASNPEGK